MLINSVKYVDACLRECLFRNYKRPSAYLVLQSLNVVALLLQSFPQRFNNFFEIVVVSLDSVDVVHPLDTDLVLVRFSNELAKHHVLLSSVV